MRRWKSTGVPNHLLKNFLFAYMVSNHLTMNWLSFGKTLPCISVGLFFKVTLISIIQEEIFEKCPGHRTVSLLSCSTSFSFFLLSYPQKVFSQPSLRSTVLPPWQKYSITFRWPFSETWKWSVSTIGQALVDFTGAPWKTELMNSIWTLFP